MPLGLGCVTLTVKPVVGTTVLIWFSTSQTFQPGNAPGAAKDLADIVVRALRQQQLL
jgi:hypothetical protein